MLFLTSEAHDGGQFISCYDSEQRSYGDESFGAFPYKLGRAQSRLHGEAKATLINRVWTLHDIAHTVGIQILSKLQPDQQHYVFSAKAEYLTIALTNQLFPELPQIVIALPSSATLRRKQSLNEADTLLLTAQLIVSSILEEHPTLKGELRRDILRAEARLKRRIEIDSKHFTIRVPQREFQVDIHSCLKKISEAKKTIFDIKLARMIGKTLAIEEYGEVRDFFKRYKIALNDKGDFSVTPNDQLLQGINLKRLCNVPLYSDPEVNARQILRTLLELDTYKLAGSIFVRHAKPVDFQFKIRGD